MLPHRGSLAPKLYQRVSDVLCSEITAGTLTPGTRVVETAVASRFAISRAPARQALAELEKQGWLRKADGRGYEVIAAPTTQTATEAAASPDFRQQASWEVIYADIELEIVSRTSVGSWRINEAVLARHYGVSRTVARDVVARLQERGIVVKDASSRWVAPALTRKHIDELYELRWTLEPLALRKAAPALSVDLLRSLSSNIERVMSAKTPVSEDLDRLEQELHVDLLGRCESDALMRAIRLPQALLVAHHFLYRQTSELFAHEPFLPEHLAIFNHLIAERLDDACEALVNHLKVSRQRAMQRIELVASTIQLKPLPYLERL